MFTYKRNYKQNFLFSSLLITKLGKATGSWKYLQTEMVQNVRKALGTWVTSGTTAPQIVELL